MHLALQTKSLRKRPASFSPGYIISVIYSKKIIQRKKNVAFLYINSFGLFFKKKKKREQEMTNAHKKVEQKELSFTANEQLFWKTI